MAKIVLCILLTPVSKTDRSDGSSLIIQVKNVMPIVVQTRREVPVMERYLFKAEICKVPTGMDAWTGLIGRKEPVLEITWLREKCI